jgi:hypothetical protein
MFDEYRNRIFLTKAMVAISKTLPECDPDYLTQEQFQALSVMLLSLKDTGKSANEAADMIVGLTVTKHNSSISTLLNTYIQMGITG